MLHTLFHNAAAHTDGFRDVDPVLLSQHIRDARIVDVREPAEFNGPLGHVSSAELVPLARLEEHAARWARDADIVLVCRSGRRSADAARVLLRMGFTRVMKLRGGMLGWNEACLPVSHE